MSSSSNEFYAFTFANGSVTGMSEIDGRKNKQKFIGSSDFSVKTNTAGSVTEVTQTTLSNKGYIETTVYSDADGDARFTESFEIDVATTAARKLEAVKFSVGSDGNVLTVQEQKIDRNGVVTWKNERLDANEQYSQVTIGSDAYVLKTEVERNGTEFTLYRDDNQDGVWTEIAEGEVHGSASVNVVDLVGLAAYLSAADALVG